MPSPINPAYLTRHLGHHHAIIGQLVEKRSRHGFRQFSTDQDAIEQRRLRPADEAIAMPQRHRIAAQIPRGTFGQASMNLDRVDLIAELGEQRRLPAAPGADLEHAPRVTEGAEHGDHG